MKVALLAIKGFLFDSHYVAGCAEDIIILISCILRGEMLSVGISFILFILVVARNAHTTFTVG